MVKEAIATGATTEEAYEKACAMLGVDPADAEFEVLETEEKKRFGLFGGRPAKVRAFIRSTPADAAAEYLRNVLSGMGLGDVNIEIREEEAGAELVLTGENIGFIIGHRGETLDSLQYLASLVANHVDESYYRITLDVGNYREKRKETLENLGRKMAARAVKTGRNASLEPMNPYERRIIHTAVQRHGGELRHHGGRRPDDFRLYDDLRQLGFHFLCGRAVLLRVLDHHRLGPLRLAFCGISVPHQ